MKRYIVRNVGGHRYQIVHRTGGYVLGYVQREDAGDWSVEVSGYGRLDATTTTRDAAANAVWLNRKGAPM